MKKRAFPSYLNLFEKGEITRRAGELWSMYRRCRLCPRNCNVDRTKGGKVIVLPAQYSAPPRII
ncbi:MAG: hypothetical protein GXO74_02175 [Calditrichaeota bacterium]|nr:hypothetical protein [Calditrichota bacterium]